MRFAIRSTVFSVFLSSTCMVNADAPGSECIPFIEVMDDECPEDRFRLDESADDRGTTVECWEKCENDKDCHYFTFVLDLQTDNLHDGECWGCKAATNPVDTATNSSSTYKNIEGYALFMADYRCAPGKGTDALRQFKVTDVSKAECYEKCKETDECEYFTYGDDEGAHQGMCLGCKADTKLEFDGAVEHPVSDYDGFNHYSMECEPEFMGASETDTQDTGEREFMGANETDTQDTGAEPTADTNSTSDCSEPYIFVMRDAKCPLIDQTERLFRTKDYERYTIEQCYERCRDTPECRYFTFGSEHVLEGKWNGMCLGCTIAAEDEEHKGFLHYFINPGCEENEYVFDEYYNAGGAKDSPPPTLSPTLSPDASMGGVKGDPHFKTWDGQLYDFHGICDLVLLYNPDFKNGLGMKIHIRSTQTRQWSYISRSVVKIGSETFEVATTRDRDNVSTDYWVNGVPDKEHNPVRRNNMVLPMKIAGYEIQYRKVHSQQLEYVIDLGEDEALSVTTWKHMIRIDLHGCKAKNFASSVGLMGTFAHSHKVGRDNSTIIENMNKFGQEWQVLPDEPMLFQTVEGPQAPSKCEIPSKTQLRRRLSESEVTVEAAQLACESTNKEDFDLCVFDVIATGDIGTAGVY